MVRLIERAAGTAVGYGLAAGAWAVALTTYPVVVAYALASAPAWHAFVDFLDDTTEALELAPLPTRTTEKENAA